MKKKILKIMKKVREHTLINKAKKFKYNGLVKLNSVLRGLSLKVKRIFNLIIKTPINWVKVNLELKVILDSFLIWFAEVAIEGAIINFALHFLLGYKFTPCTTIAYGLVIDRVVNIYWRLKQNGSDKKLLKKQ
jgi:hypothetical protein